MPRRPIALDDPHRRRVTAAFFAVGMGVV